MSHDHYEIGVWVDFVRGLVSASQLEEMRTHLAACDACSVTADLLGRLWKTGQQSEQPVPETWSQRAEDILREQTLGVLRRLPARRAAPAFGRSAILQAAAVRSSSGLSRHTIYEAESCVIDVAIEDGPSPQELSIVGQIRGRSGGEGAVASIPIYLRRGKKLLAATSSNEFGEFQLAAALQHKMSLSFPFDGFRIDVMLDDRPQGKDNL